MADAISLLLVEDDARLASFLADYLAGHDIRVRVEGDGDAGVDAAMRTRFDLILLDVMLPLQSGLQVCRAIREVSDVPIMMITARTEEADRVLGLETGADDYVIKPFSPRELLARIHAMIRRDRRTLGPRARTVVVGPLEVNTGTRMATLAGEPLPLTTAEFELVLALASRPGRILSREQLLRASRGTDADTFDRAVDVQISRIRQKLAGFTDGAALIRTVRGVGYMLTEPRPLG
jgi:two-component system response regulator RstA